jgi:hypothetical protein
MPTPQGRSRLGPVAEKAAEPNLSRGLPTLRQVECRGVGEMACRPAFVGVLVGTPFFNHVEPFILGMPPILAWIVLWIGLTAAIMAIIYVIDPANHDAPEGD